jgi:hypothetical protein
MMFHALRREQLMFERYALDAKKAIFLAHIEAVHRNEQSISVGDLLAGIAWDAESRACQIAPLKEKVMMLRALVGIPHLPITSRPYERGTHIPLDDDAKKAVAYAAEEADLDRQYWIDSDHLLRGLLRFSNNAAEAMSEADIHLDSLRSLSVQHRNEFPPAPPPKWSGAKKVIKKYWSRALMAAILLLIFAYIKLQG